MWMMSCPMRLHPVYPNEVHVAASCNNILDGCEFVGPLKMQKDVVKNPLHMEGGKVRVPDDSGLGCGLDEEKLEECSLV